MPGIYKISCDRCDFAREGGESVIFVVGEDGAEIICPHPGEFMMAERATGKTYEVLKQEGRFRFRRTYLCLTCGEVGHYGKRGDMIEGVADGTVQAMATGYPRWYVAADQVHRSPKTACARCGQETLYPMTGPGTNDPALFRLFGCLFGLFFLIVTLLWEAAINAIRRKPANMNASLSENIRFLCPQCRQGRLQWAMIGRS